MNQVKTADQVPSVHTLRAHNEEDEHNSTLWIWLVVAAVIILMVVLYMRYKYKGHVKKKENMAVNIEEQPLIIDGLESNIQINF